jgi:Streptomycin adenylyltransferase
MEHERVVAAVTRWARQDGNIRAVVLTGSVAAPGAADALSDLDIELYAIDPHALLQSSSWYHEFGEVLVVEALPNPGWHPTGSSTTPAARSTSRSRTSTAARTAATTAPYGSSSTRTG